MQHGSNTARLATGLGVAIGAIDLPRLVGFLRPKGEVDRGGLAAHYDKLVVSASCCESGCEYKVVDSMRMVHLEPYSLW